MPCTTKHWYVPPLGRKSRDWWTVACYWRTANMFDFIKGLAAIWRDGVGFGLIIVIMWVYLVVAHQWSMAYV